MQKQSSIGTCTHIYTQTDMNDCESNPQYHLLADTLDLFVAGFSFFFNGLRFL